MARNARKENFQRLIPEALKAKKNSYSPYSKFRVGAALLSQSGKIFTGCNIENSSFSLTQCAERTALFKAISESERKFTAIAISSDSGKYITPCGACRQVLLELAGNIDVILVNSKGKSKVTKLAKLLPLPFDGKMFK